MHKIDFLQPAVSLRDFEGLCALLGDAIEHGASMGFMKPLDLESISAYWRRVIGELDAGNRLLWVSRDSTGALTGTVQLATETRANGRHRAEVQKLIVLYSSRGLGIARSLMQAVEAAAASQRLTLLFLDTSEGPGGACGFYRKLGYEYAGGIPGYALDPDGTPAANAIFYKRL